MDKNRLESFSDGVLAIIITIMVLNLTVPTGSDFKSLYHTIPIFLGYVLSFIYVGIYWNNHHHLLKAAKNISGRVLWANLIFLFWVSLLPFSTAWMAQNYFIRWPTMLYGIVILMAGISFLTLQREIIKADGEESKLKKAIGDDYKGKITILLKFIAIFIAIIIPIIAQLIYIIVVIIWLLPDTRIERVLD